MKGMFWFPLVREQKGMSNADKCSETQKEGVICLQNHTRMIGCVAWGNKNRTGDAGKNSSVHQFCINRGFFLHAGMCGTPYVVFSVPVMTDCISEDLYGKGCGLLVCLYLGGVATAYAVEGD